jgi:hypothetical protein
MREIAWSEVRALLSGPRDGTLEACASTSITMNRPGF